MLSSTFKTTPKASLSKLCSHVAESFAENSSDGSNGSRAGKDDDNITADGIDIANETSLDLKITPQYEAVASALKNAKDNLDTTNESKRPDPCCRKSLAAMSISADGDDDDEKEAVVPDDQPTLETVVQWIKYGLCRNIVVLSGAGVSCAAGIPDFRTPGTGLYDNLEKFGLPYPEAIFDVSFYEDNPRPFVSLAAELWPGMKYSPTLSHCFVALLESKNLLVRNFTQNIDGLEILAGVSEDKLVECHGHFRTASCTSCDEPFDGKECKRQIVEEQMAPKCPECEYGMIKPDIVFFGESLPVRFRKVLHGDLENADLLIVMGTSLNVAPVSLIPEMVNGRCPRVLINHELVGDIDIFEQGNCDDIVLELCKLLGWEEELMSLHASVKLNMD